ncbi:MAG: kynurenine 3-monooxygenase, mitochondrial precursor, partial [Peltula sp. TS41687]
MDTAKEKTVVVGAGPVGALAALYAATLGGEVEIYELRGDLRDPNTVPLNFTRSINLALSERGINALQSADCPGLLEAICEETIPMYGRMIHGRDTEGNHISQSQAYDIHGQAIFAIDRSGLNQRLLEHLENLPNVKIFFDHKLTGADFDKKLAWFERRDSVTTTSAGDRAAEIEVPFDFMIGADGAHSAVRYHMMKYARVNYQQEYIDTLWCEFHIPPLSKERGGGFRLSPNDLHIWPCKDYMFIAIPSLDHSFTCTLFASAEIFSSLLDSEEFLQRFFQQSFPGLVPDLISLSAIKAQVSRNPHLPLISIKCTPYHYKDACVILGDAAHAMVPFYGQGMNAGLEDVRVLFEHFRQHNVGTCLRPRGEVSRAQALQEYTKRRTPDAHVINDLALCNYVEMRSSVRSPPYRVRKWIEERFSLWFPQAGWSTQYARISFSNEPYSEVQNSVRTQGRILSALLLSSVLGAMTTIVGAVWWMRRGR